MKKHLIFLLLTSHAAVAVLGFAVGIYVLPILTAPPAPSTAEVQALAEQMQYQAIFRKDLQDSDALHWGEGEVSIGERFISFSGELAPGPDYKLYLSPEFVETEADFLRLKSSMVQVGDVRTFDNFIVDVPTNIKPADFNSVIVWCESFGQFITAAQYR